MKYTFAILALLFSLQINAQIPDSLEVDLPWQVVRFSSCDDTMGEGPKSDKSGVHIILESDIVEKDNLGNCILRTRKWIVIDGLSGSLYSFSQLGVINFPEPLMCKEEVYLTSDQLPYTLTKDNLLLNEDENHEYSFSYDDKDDIEREIKTGWKANYNIYIYDHTANKICRTNVYKTHCEEDIVIDVPEMTEIVFNGEPYLELTPEMLGVEIEYPCDTYTTKIRIWNQSNSILSAQKVGELITVELDIYIDGGMWYTNNINVIVTGIKPDPLAMYVEDKTFVAGETIELDVWSQSISGLAAWGLQLEFENAELLALENAETFHDIPINLYPDGKTVRALWYSFTGLPIDIESEDTWFRLVIKPEIDGSSIDIFKSAQNPWNHIAIEDENYVHEIDAEFIFNVAPRNILGIDDELHFSSLNVYPNPVSNKLIINGLPASHEPVMIGIFDLEGRLVLQNTTENYAKNFTIDISELPTGMFMLKAQNGRFLTSHKIIKN